ncbi:carbon-nitrogen hydrolase family protein [Helicobacter anseris]|uniref:Carbon-nitrogen hydrolase family protein n=1 Tax=Helicobacter anseris TaxID=375926 RepID=A0A3D8J1W7_9HELI|nr:carbon-nitrogen hydrolase family protein [Helicobacter anseris]RDU71363.1 carbon-nitrogen hydrolase family protein [Helicobacter anseris]
MIFKKIYTLQPHIHQDFNANLEFLLKQINQAQKDSIILAPEVMLTGFAYQKMEEASEFSRIATEKILDATTNKTCIITMIEKNNQMFFNNLKVFHNNEVIHKQAKTKLFVLGDEHLHFKQGDIGECVPFMIDGIKCSALICFELRFPQMWDLVRDSDMVFVCAQWGGPRKEHFETLSRAMAILNQSYVITSNPKNLQMAKGSAIISPYGLVFKNDRKEVIELEVNLEEVSRVRKYIQVRGK